MALRSAYRCLAFCAAVYNSFNLQRHLMTRATLRRFRAAAIDAWKKATAAA